MTTVVATENAQWQRLVPLLEIVQLVCLGWVAWLPVSREVVLYPALFLIFVSSAGLLVVRRWRPSRALVVAWGVYYAWAVAWTAVSWSWGNPGVWHQASLWLGLPLLWGTWALSLDGPQVRRTLHLLLAIGSIAAVITLWLTSSGIWGWPGLPTWLAELQDTRVNVSPSGETAFNWLGLSPFIGIGSIAVAGAILPLKDAWLPRRSMLLVAAALIFAAASASGRNGLLLALLVVAVATAGVGLLIVVRRDGLRRIGSYVGALVVGAAAVVGFAFTPVGDNVGQLAPEIAAVVLPGVEAPAPVADDPIDQVEAGSDEVRRATFPELFDAIRDSPIWGHGFGATLDSGFVRSETRPWMFEEEPLQALMNVGILGLLVLCFPLSLLVRTVVRALRERVHVGAVIVGVAVFGAIVLASNTNPYVQAPAHGWMLFIAGGIAQAALGSSRAEKAGQRTDTLAA